MKILRTKLLASIELAAGDTISTRTILTHAGGVAALRELTPAKAMTAIRKAASELQSTRKKDGKPYKVDKEELTTWVKENSGGANKGTGSSAPAKKQKETPATNLKEFSARLTNPADKKFLNSLTSKEFERVLDAHEQGKKPEDALYDLMYKKEKGIKDELNPEDKKFAEGKHLPKVKTDKNGVKAIGNSKLSPNGKGGFTITWSANGEHDKVEIKSVADIPKVARTLEKDWKNWVRLFNAGSVSKRQLRSVKDSYEEYISLMQSAKNDSTTSAPEKVAPASKDTAKKKPVSTEKPAVEQKEKQTTDPLGSYGTAVQKAKDSKQASVKLYRSSQAVRDLVEAEQDLERLDPDNQGGSQTKGAKQKLTQQISKLKNDPQVKKYLELRNDRTTALKERKRVEDEALKKDPSLYTLFRERNKVVEQLNRMSYSGSHDVMEKKAAEIQSRVDKAISIALKEKEPAKSKPQVQEQPASKPEKPVKESLKNAIRRLYSRNAQFTYVEKKLDLLKFAVEEEQRNVKGLSNLDTQGHPGVAALNRAKDDLDAAKKKYEDYKAQALKGNLRILDNN